MGCDIHIFIEYKQHDYWNSFGGEIYGGRDYTLFGLLAGVRGDKDPIFSPRGMPEDAAFESKHENELALVPANALNPYSGHTCAYSDAERWTRAGSCKWTDNSHTKITNPNWHSHSWLTTSEFKQILSKHRHYDTTYKAILAVMKAFESDGFPARIVFWFDN